MKTLSIVISRNFVEYVFTFPFSVVNDTFIVGPLPRVRPRNGILALGLGLVVVLVLPLRSEFIGEL